MVAALVTTATDGCPVTGVQGEPVWYWKIPLICHPLRMEPTMPLPFLYFGRSQSPATITRWRLSKSDGAYSVIGLAGSVWLESAPGPSFDAWSMLLEYV